MDDGSPALLSVTRNKRAHQASGSADVSAVVGGYALFFATFFWAQQKKVDSKYKIYHNTESKPTNPIFQHTPNHELNSSKDE